MALDEYNVADVPATTISTEENRLSLQGLTGKFRSLLLMSVLMAATAANAADRKCTTATAYMNTKNDVDFFASEYPEQLIGLQVDDHAGRTFYDFIRAYLEETNQLPRNEPEARAYLAEVIRVCRTLNSDMDLDDFDSIAGQEIAFPMSLSMVTTCSQDLSFAPQLTTITVPAGKGYLWIEKTYGIPEENVIALNPELRSRGLQKGETLKIPNRVKD